MDQIPSQDAYFSLPSQLFYFFPFFSPVVHEGMTLVLCSRQKAYCLDSNGKGVAAMTLPTTSNVHTQPKKAVFVKEFFTFIVLTLKTGYPRTFLLNYELGLYRVVAKWREAVQLWSCTKPLGPLKWGEETGVPLSPGNNPALQSYLSLHLLVLSFFSNFCLIMSFLGLD